MTIVDAILDRADGTGTLTAGEQLSWALLHERARRMAAVLAEAGVRPGSRVGLLSDTSADLVAALQAVWLAGAAVTVLPPRPGRLGPLLADARLDLVITAGDAIDTAPVPALALAELATRAAGARPHPVRRPDPADLAVLQYTSGSTRDPRGVPVTHAHLAANLAALDDLFPADVLRAGPMLSWLPLHHDLGLIGFLAFPMSRGHSLVLYPPRSFALRPASWLEALSRHRAVGTAAPDFAYRVVTPLLAAGMELDLRNLRFVLSGAEPIAVPAMRRFLTAAARYGLDPAAAIAAYGLAESTLVVTCSRPGAGLTADPVDPDALERDGRATPPRAGGRIRLLARLGRPVLGTRLRVVDPVTGAPVGDREVGEIEVRGASVVGHYWGDPSPPAGAWLRTGDLGYLADGELVVCGRRKDVLFAAGRNLYPADIEVAAGQVPGVRTGGAVAFGVPGEEGDRLVVVIESRADDRSRLCRAVAAAVTAETGMRPAHVLALPPGRLPRTSSGKLRRAEARQRYQSGQLVAERTGR